MTPPFPGAPTPADHFIRVAAMLVAAPVAGQSDEREAPDARKGKPSLPARRPRRLQTEKGDQ